MQGHPAGHFQVALKVFTMCSCRLSSLWYQICEIKSESHRGHLFCFPSKSSLWGYEVYVCGGAVRQGLDIWTKPRPHGVAIGCTILFVKLWNCLQTRASLTTTCWHPQCVIEALRAPLTQQRIAVES